MEVIGREVSIIARWVNNVLNKQWQLETHLPQEYQQLKMYCDSLPFWQRTRLYPFGGFVLNIRACTKAHRDKLDTNDMCVLLFLGDWQDGDLVLYEPGLRFKVTRGDILIFPSTKLTYFNLHYEGSRISLVSHTDSNASRWLRDRNGWIRHINVDEEDYDVSDSD